MNRVATKNDFEKVIQKLNERLKKAFFDFRGIIFFGSRHGSAYSHDSDFDIVLLFAKNVDWKRQNQALDMVYEVALKNDIVIDAKVYKEKDILKRNTPFRENVVGRGTFYAA